MAVSVKKQGSWTVPLIAFVLGVAVAALIGFFMRPSGTQNAAEEASAETEAAATEEAADAADAEAASEEAADEPLDLQATFPSWNQDSASLAALIDFVEDVTDPSSPNYVDPVDRIATFDMDGTMLCEKAPVYADYCLLMYRVLEDPDYHASKSLISTCKKLRANADEGIVDGALDEAKNEAFARAFEGMTQAEFAAYANNFFDTVDVEGFSGMTYGGSFYHPMAEVMNYLRANDFDVYMVSACEREVVRAAVRDRLGIEPDHVMGADTAFVATGQKDLPDDQYTVTQDDELVLSDVLTFPTCAKGGKVTYIQREIGKVPLLSFGNSSGDFAMLNYAQGNDEHRGMGVLVVADDTEREYGNDEKAESMKAEAEAEGWTVFSMRDDWATIYGEGVEKTAYVADLELADAA